MLLNRQAAVPQAVALAAEAEATAVALREAQSQQEASEYQARCAVVMHSFGLQMRTSACSVFWCDAIVCAEDWQ